MEVLVPSTCLLVGRPPRRAPLQRASWFGVGETGCDGTGDWGPAFAQGYGTAGNRPYQFLIHWA